MACTSVGFKQGTKQYDNDQDLAECIDSMNGSASNDLEPLPSCAAFPDTRARLRSAVDAAWSAFFDHNSIQPWPSSLHSFCHVRRRSRYLR